MPPVTRRGGRRGEDDFATRRGRGRGGVVAGGNEGVPVHRRGSDTGRGRGGERAQGESRSCVRGRGRGLHCERGQERGRSESRRGRGRACERGQESERSDIGRGRGRTCERGRGRGRTCERRQGRGRSEIQRGRGRSCERGQRGRGRGGERGRGRGRGQGGRMGQADRQRVQALQEARMQRIREAVLHLQLQELRNIVERVLQRQPFIMFDIWEQIYGQGPIQPGMTSVPEWCRCQNCRPMGTDVENLCCGYTPQNCLSLWPDIELVCLEEQVLLTANQYAAEFFVAHPGHDNRAMRRAAYRQFTLWRHGHLGQGNRRVIPSCIVMKIRSRYPELSGIYTGFIRHRLA